MEVFGKKWTGYTERLEKNWRAVVSDGDTVVIPGDVSWSISLPGTQSDFSFLHALPGKKILGKGNHDFWWSTETKMNAYLSSLGFDDIRFLHNNAFLCDGRIVCGTRGWFSEDDEGAHGDFEKLVNREATRLQLSLDAAKAIAVMLKNPDKDWRYLYENTNAKALPIAAVPTTCGTGSEVTGVAVLTRHDLKTKVSMTHRIFPTLALVDGKYILNTPHRIIVNTAIDALSHLIESVINTLADKYSDMVAFAGLNAWRECKPFIENETPLTVEAAQKLMHASTLARAELYADLSGQYSARNRCRHFSGKLSLLCRRKQKSRYSSSGRFFKY